MLPRLSGCWLSRRSLRTGAMPAGALAAQRPRPSGEVQRTTSWGQNRFRASCIWAMNEGFAPAGSIRCRCPWPAGRADRCRAVRPVRPATCGCCPVHQPQMLACRPALLQTGPPCARPQSHLRVSVLHHTTPSRQLLPVRSKSDCSWTLCVYSLRLGFYDLAPGNAKR